MAKSKAQTTSQPDPAQLSAERQQSHQQSIDMLNQLRAGKTPEQLASNPSPAAAPGASAAPAAGSASPAPSPEPASPAPGRDARGRFAPKSSAEASAASAATDTGDDTETDTATPPAKPAATTQQPSQAAPAAVTPERQKQYEEAMQYLLRDGVYELEDLQNQSPDWIIAKGAKAKERRDALDKRWNESQTRIKELEAARVPTAEAKPGQPTPPAASAAAEAKPGEPAHPASGEFAALADPISKTFQEIFGDDVELTPKLQQFAAGIVRAAQEQARQQADATTSTLQQQMQEFLAEQARPDLVKVFPALEDPQQWGANVEKARHLVKAGIVGDWKTALKSAAAMSFGLQAGQQAADARSIIDKAKVHGQPYSGAQQTAPAAHPSHRDEANSFLNRRRAGASLAEAKQAAGIG